MHWTDVAEHSHWLERLWLVLSLSGMVASHFGLWDALKSLSFQVIQHHDMPEMHILALGHLHREIIRVAVYALMTFAAILVNVLPPPPPDLSQLPEVIILITLLCLTAGLGLVSMALNQHMRMRLRVGNQHPGDGF